MPWGLLQYYFVHLLKKIQTMTYAVASILCINVGHNSVVPGTLLVSRVILAVICTSKLGRH